MKEGAPETSKYGSPNNKEGNNSPTNEFSFFNKGAPVEEVKEKREAFPCYYTTPNQHMMQFVSPYIMKDEVASELQRKGQLEAQPVNLGCVRLNWLVDLTGLNESWKPIKCKNCGALLNNLSPFKDGLWTCEFCNYANQFKPEEAAKINVPSQGTMLKTSVQEEAKSKSEISIVLCIDKSGSMCENVKDKITLSNIKRKEAKGNIEISVWTLVTETISDLLDKIAKEKPDAIVGLIFFSQDLIIAGDCKSFDEDLVIPLDDKSLIESRSKLEQMIQGIDKALGGCMKLPIRETIDSLKKKLAAQEASGSTPLGPCLVAAETLLREAKRGSQILVFTDGKPNVGMGKLEVEKDEKADPQFYSEMSDLLMERGLRISFFTFGNRECSLINFNMLTDKTMGMIRQFSDRTEKSNIDLQYTNAQVSDVHITYIADSRLVLHDIDYTARPELLAGPLKDNRKVIFDSSVCYFEYQPHPKNFSVASAKARPCFPIQAQISYALDGREYLRVATDRIYYTEQFTPVPFKDHAAIRHYAAKLGKIGLSLKPEDKRIIREKLERLHKYCASKAMKMHARYLEEISECAKRLKDDVKVNDKLVSAADEQVTSDVHIVRKYKLPF